MIRNEKKYQSYFECCTYVVLSKTLLCLIITIALYAIFECYHINQYSDLTHNTWEEFHRITSTFLPGVIISIFFYYLVVNIPERRRHFIIKSNLHKMYVIIKRDILVEIICASRKGGIQGITNDSDTIDSLMTVDGFRSVFAGGNEADEGWYAFQNGLGKDGMEFKEIISNLQLLSKQIDFVLQNYKMLSSQELNILKLLQIDILKMENLQPPNVEPYREDDNILIGFLWQMFSGWSVISGRLGYDPIEKIIKEITSVRNISRINSIG